MHSLSLVRRGKGPAKAGRVRYNEANMPKLALENPDNKVNILGVGVTSTELAEVLTKIDQTCLPAGRFAKSSLKKTFFIVTVNQEFVMLAQDDPEFKDILNQADLALADGFGLKLAKADLQIVPGRKLVESLLHRNLKMFYLGGQDGVAEQMAEKFGGGFDLGETDVSHPTRNAEILKKINVFEPDVLLVAYGAPWQEKWIWANKDQIQTKVVMGVGGAFDYLTGRAKMPPEWVNKWGLEWLWRLLHEPWRWRRQLALLRFVWRLWSS